MTNILFFGASFNFWTIYRGLNQMFDFNPFYFDKEISNKNKKKFHNNDITEIKNFSDIINNKYNIDKFIITYGGIYANIIRYELGNYLEKNTKIKSMGYIDPSAQISKYAKIHKNALIFENAVIQDDVKISSYSIINCSAIITHSTVIKKGCHIMPGSILNGNCTINDFSSISSGSIIAQNITIGKNNVIGAGSVVLDNTIDNTFNAGTPAIKIRNNEKHKFNLQKFI